MKYHGNLLFVADSVYTKHENEIFGLRVFGREFFDAYLKVFDTVTICARVQQVDQRPKDLPRTDSERIRFVGLPNVHGIRWLLGCDTRIRSSISTAAEKADALVSRVPSTTGFIAYHAAKKLRKPFLAEVVGDPLDSISNYGKGPAFQALGWIYYLRFKRFMKQQKLASYVSRRILGVRYPAADDALVEEYSSVRLSADRLLQSKAYDAPPKTLQVLCLLSFLGYKRHIDLIHAAEILHRAGISFHLHMAGDGPEKSFIVQRCQELGISDATTFYGYVADAQELNEIIDRCNVVVVPSAQEGLPRSMLEGMSRGLAATGSEVGGIPDLARETEVFSLGDVDHLAKILKRFAGSAKELSAASEHAINTARQYTAPILEPRRTRMYQALANQAGCNDAII
ncbi:2-deoxystreptamine glucosyltransferase [Crateriforma conspicua]|nr:2-deoxystreptamine glucosyltransferase [Crateriforma conspicua]